MRFSQDFPGLCSVSFAPAVSAERLHEFERWAQKHIHTNYQVHRISETSERILISTSACSDCPTLLPVTLHTHVYRPGVLKTRKTTQLGRDLLDPNEPEFPLINPSTYPMVLSARKDQEASAGQLEELYTLNNAKPPIRGTRIFLGVFTTQSNLSRLGQSAIYSPPGQRKNLGVLVSSIDWQEFFDSALRAQKSEIGFMLYRPEGKQGAGRFIVAQSSPSLPPEGTSPLEATYQCRFYGRRLHFELRPLPSFFEHSERQWPLVIAVLGIALSVGVAALVFIQTRARVVEVATGQQLRASHEQLQHLLQDRERISRDLHDGTIQSIYAIGLGLKRTQKLIDQNPSLAHTQLGETIGELDLAISELRQFILSLEPNLASGESLTYALNALVSRCRRITPSTIELSVDDKFQADLSAYLSVHLLNLIREGLTNSIRHASARTIAIRLQQEASELRLQITDDGVGFDTELASSSGSGHRNMRARVQEVGGTLTISSANGSGTTILAILPMPGVTDGPSSPRAPL